jgi:pimeloyl-ACP methyl ester carboxylesterase
MTTFVLVHGAWHGPWCWERTAESLRGAGHQVFTPTLTGLGDRADRLSRDVTLHTHADDIGAFLAREDLRDVVLVGHSYAGMVVRQAADGVPDRIARLVLLDAWAAPDGGSIADIAPDWFITALDDSAGSDGDGWLIPPPPAVLLGVTEPDDVVWLEARLTPHPWRTFHDATRLTGAVDALPCHAIICTADAVMPFGDHARENGWPSTELRTGHDAMITMPAELADALQRA